MTYKIETTILMCTLELFILDLECLLYFFFLKNALNLFWKLLQVLDGTAEQSVSKYTWILINWFA